MNKKITPRIPTGFMELLPQEQIVYNRMLYAIRETYELFGFTPIETPSLELAEIILAKAGGETEKQIYSFKKGDTDYCLPFDLTVPLARYVAANQHELNFPFRRYQIQKVWRAEKPQKGRLREFYQCDIDVIGSDNLLNDAEIPSVIYSVFTKLGLPKFTVKINNRKILNGFMESLGLSKLGVDILRIIDKIDKIGVAGVSRELGVLDIDRANIKSILDFISISGTNKKILESIKALNIKKDLYTQGIKELETIVDAIASFGVPENYCQINLSITRGLDYYTGIVYETTIDAYPAIGSICSGGRYDDLASFYTDKKLPGVGMSIGFTRLFQELKNQNLISFDASTPAKVLVARLDKSKLPEALRTSSILRENSIKTEVYFDDDKLGKQLKYANRCGFKYVAIVGADESKKGQILLKNMQTGDQQNIDIAEAIKELS